MTLGGSLRVLKTKWFARFTRRVRIGDETLCEAVQRAESGLIDADLGGSIIKQRVARPGQGRSGGHRVLIGYRRRDRAVFIYGFAKNELLEQALMEGRAEEVHCGEKG